MRFASCQRGLLCAHAQVWRCRRARKVRSCVAARSLSCGGGPHSVVCLRCRALSPVEVEACPLSKYSCAPSASVSGSALCLCLLHPLSKCTCAPSALAPFPSARVLPLLWLPSALFHATCVTLPRSRFPCTLNHCRTIFPSTSSFSLFPCTLLLCTCVRSLPVHLSHSLSVLFRTLFPCTLFPWTFRALPALSCPALACHLHSLKCYSVS